MQYIKLGYLGKWNYGAANSLLLLPNGVLVWNNRPLVWNDKYLIWNG